MFFNNSKSCEIMRERLMLMKRETTLNGMRILKKADKKGIQVTLIGNQVKLPFQNPQALIILKSSKMTIKELKAELKRRNAQGFSQKNKSELLKQLKEICQEEHIGKSVCNEHGVSHTTWVILAYTALSHKNCFYLPLAFWTLQMVCKSIKVLVSAWNLQIPNK